MTIYSDALVVLGTAGVVVPLLRRWQVNPVLAYLGAGAILGPFGLGSFISRIPALFWVTVVDAQSVQSIADLGIVFLLFMIGLELPFQRLRTMRRLVFGLGGLQVLVSAAAIGGIVSLLTRDTMASVVLGAALSLSSTAIVLELLTRRNRLFTNAGRASFAVLLAQDIAVIPILIFISIAGSGIKGPVAPIVGAALLQALAAIAVILVFGRFLMRPLFRLVATVHSSDLFVAAVLLVIIGAGVVAHQAGMSMALGAFIAGLLLAETEYVKSIQAVVEPYKGLLLGIFFFTIGMSIDPREVLRQPGALAAGSAALICGKAVLTGGAAKLFRLSWPAAIETGLLLGPAGEFAFVGITLAAAQGLVAPEIAKFTLVLVSLTMAATPLLDLLGRRIRPLIARSASLDPELAVRPASGVRHAIVIGYGRVGRVVGELLQQHGIAFIAADRDAFAVARDRRRGHPVFFGDASDPEFLRVCGLMDATGIIITIDVPDTIDEIVRHVRAVRPDILLVARARDADHARHLYAIGASDAVPETIEASLQVSEAALVGLGAAMGPVIASIHEKRDAFRRDLQQAALTAGREESHALMRRR